MVHIKTLVGTAVIAALGGAFTSYSLISPTTTTSGSNNNDSPQGSQVDYAAQRANTALAETIKQLQHKNDRLKNYWPSSILAICARSSVGRPTGKQLSQFIQ